MSGSHRGRGGGTERVKSPGPSMPVPKTCMLFDLVDNSGKRFRGRYTLQQARNLAQAMNTGKPPSKWVRVRVA